MGGGRTHQSSVAVNWTWCQPAVPSCTSQPTTAQSQSQLLPSGVHTQHRQPGSPHPSRPAATHLVEGQTRLAGHVPGTSGTLAAVVATAAGVGRVAEEAGGGGTRSAELGGGQRARPHGGGRRAGAWNDSGGRRAGTGDGGRGRGRDCRLDALHIGRPAKRARAKKACECGAFNPKGAGESAACTGQPAPALARPLLRSLGHQHPENNNYQSQIMWRSLKSRPLGHC